MTIEQLTPEERHRVQMIFLRRWLARRHPKGSRRRSDSAGPVKRFDAKGARVT